MAPSRAPAKKPKKPAEARLLGLASFILEQGGTATRERIYAAFPDDYRGSAAAREKKFSRDKEALHHLGFAMEAEQVTAEEVAYSIDAQACILPAIQFTPEEAALVWTAGTSALRLSRHPLRDDLESALRKLAIGARGLPPRATLAEELSAPAGPDDEKPSRTAKHLSSIIDAWERRRRIRLRYWRASEGKEVEREVDVYGWARRRGEWLFAGYCHLRQGVRVFYVSRVRGVSAPRGAMDRGYQIPAGFDIRRWSRQQIWDYEVHPPIEAAVAFRGPLARLARQLLPGAKVETDASGARIARLPVRNLRGLVRQALAWGPDAELLVPEQGRALAREILAAMSKEVRP
jgi:proteasome accessory factor B